MHRFMSMLIVAALAAICLWIAIPTRPPGIPAHQPPEIPTPVARPGAAPLPRAPAVEAAPAPAAQGAEAAYYRPLDRLNDPAQDIEADLKLLVDLFFHYQVAVKDPSGNPIGDNAEIVRALQGRNRARLAFLPERHPALNDRGELRDRWGTPFFFHAVSGTRMDVRSAGPDRTMWTDDDVVLPRAPGRPDRALAPQPGR